MPEVYGSASRCFEHHWEIGEGVTSAEIGEGVTSAGGEGVMSAGGESGLISGESSGEGVTIGEIGEGVVGGAVGGAGCYTFSCTQESVVVQVGRSEVTCGRAGERVRETR